MKSLKSSFEKLFKSSKENHHDTKHMEGKYQKIGPTIHRSVSQVTVQHTKPDKKSRSVRDVLQKLQSIFKEKCDLGNLETRWCLVSVWNFVSK